MQPSPVSTLVIILGASEFPRAQCLSASEAFRQSAQAIAAYFVDRDGFSLHHANLLNLFNSKEGVSEQDHSISCFLETRIKELTESNVQVEDLILYYVGHGGFTAPHDQYFLALHSTREGSESISGYPIHTLAGTLKLRAPHLRRYVILDCCFSAVAHQSFQSSGPLMVAREKTREELPDKGTALLCAAGAREPAKTPLNEPYTMFSGALIHVLRDGAPDLPSRLSLNEVGERVRAVIKDRFKNEAVRPQVLSPDERSGDVASLPLFPNPGRSIASLWEALNGVKTDVQQLKSQSGTIAGMITGLSEKVRSVEVALERRCPPTPNQAPAVTPSVVAQSLRKGVSFRRREAMPSIDGLTANDWARMSRTTQRVLVNYRKKSHMSQLFALLSLGINMVGISIVFISLLTGASPLDREGMSSTRPTVNSAKMEPVQRIATGGLIISFCLPLLLVKKKRAGFGNLFHYKYFKIPESARVSNDSHPLVQHVVNYRYVRLAGLPVSRFALKFHLILSALSGLTNFIILVAFRFLT